MTVRENDDPRSPSRQYADWLRDDRKIQNIGVINASEILWKANIVREALRGWHTYGKRISFADYLNKWIETAKSMIE